MDAMNNNNNNNNKDVMGGNIVVTPQLSELQQKYSGDVLQMRGLMQVIANIYVEGMSLEDLQLAVGTAVSKQLEQSLAGLDPVTAQSVVKVLQQVGYNLSLDYNKAVRDGRTM